MEVYVTPFTSMEVASSTSMKLSIYLHLLPWKLASSSPASVEATNYFHVLPWQLASLHGGSYSLRLRLALVLWKHLEVCGARASRWKYVGVYEILVSWTLPRNIFVEAIDGSNGSFHFHRQWKIPMYFHGSFH